MTARAGFTAWRKTGPGAGFWTGAPMLELTRPRGAVAGWTRTGERNG